MLHIRYSLYVVSWEKDNFLSLRNGRELITEKLTQVGTIKSFRIDCTHMESLD